jgi:hypothetical protein
LKVDAVRLSRAASVNANVGDFVHSTRYFVASVTSAQSNVGRAFVTVVPETGLTRPGAAGGSGAAGVVKVRMADQALVPAALVALARQ